MRFRPVVILTCLLELWGGATRGGTFSVSSFTGDADSGINGAYNYTSLADFGGTGVRSVNGALFGNTGLTGTNYVLSGASFGSISAGSTSLTGSSAGLVSDFALATDGSGNGVLTLSGLTIGQSYTTSWYNNGWTAAGGRFVTITPSDTGTGFTYDQDYRGPGLGSILTYTYVATAPTITYNFDAVNNADAFHYYAFSNRQTSPLASGYTQTISTAPFIVRNNDLLQTSVASVSLSGSFNLEGTGGASVLTNGAFSITGVGGNNPQLATGTNGAFAQYNLDLSVHTLGYDISSIETYGGWNDGGRDRQLFSVSYSLVGSSAFTLLTTADYNPTGVTSGPSAVRWIFPTALTGVDAIRFDFLNGQESGYAGYGELDVVGAATVPEPSAALLFAGAVVGLYSRRRRPRHPLPNRIRK